MSDLISRSALERTIKRCRAIMIDGNYYVRMHTVLDKILAASAVDAVAVVRCKDCEYGYKADEFGKGCILCGTHDRVTGPDDFCDCGQKRKRVKHEAD